MKRIIYLFVILLFVCSIRIYSQTQENEITFAFKKEGNQFFKINELNQKELNFIVFGLNYQKDVEKTEKMFREKENVISFNISPMLMADLGRYGKMIFTKETKLADFKQILIALGVKQVIVDGKTMKTEEIGKPYKNAAGE